MASFTESQTPWNIEPKLGGFIPDLGPKDTSGGSKIRELGNKLIKTAQGTGERMKEFFAPQPEPGLPIGAAAMHADVHVIPIPII